MGEVSFHIIDTKGFDGKKQNERFNAAGSRCRKNLKFENFKATTLKKCTKTRAARAARFPHSTIREFKK